MLLEHLKTLLQAWHQLTTLVPALAVAVLAIGSRRRKLHRIGLPNTNSGTTANLLGRLGEDDGDALGCPTAQHSNHRWLAPLALPAVLPGTMGGHCGKRTGLPDNLSPLLAVAPGALRACLRRCPWGRGSARPSANHNHGRSQRPVVRLWAGACGLGFAGRDPWCPAETTIGRSSCAAVAFAIFGCASANVNCFLWLAGSTPGDRKKSSAIAHWAAQRSSRQPPSRPRSPPRSCAVQRKGPPRRWPPVEAAFPAA